MRASKYIVTGGCGFIGSNLVRKLNEEGVEDITVVDRLGEGEKWKNLRGLSFSNYVDKEAFRKNVNAGGIDGDVEVVFHQGACTDTTERDGRYMLENNFAYTRDLIEWASDAGVRLIYASSAAVYGKSRCFDAAGSDNLSPVNKYGLSKLLIDNYVDTHADHLDATVLGLRYFNVYGPGEGHKGEMASMVRKMADQVRAGEAIRLFEGTDGFADGGQKRDFVHVDDVCRANIFAARADIDSGVINVGTGTARSFNELAEIIFENIRHTGIEYIPFPDELDGKYQSFTEASLEGLREMRYGQSFMEVEEGISRYCDYLVEN
ncbi:ADP-glyceromanno-heptose 6-epimerase [Salinibacter ruber]|uniref:ADP-glyceromanno-heptose 6-epimerase n=1 Tax=Salinibacter ruber TaxID=146919 RepID=UPI002073CFDD|nr:ADP-glyceromanno-heptose 6-epimerase [Salinibacter ruber]